MITIAGPMDLCNVTVVHTAGGSTGLTLAAVGACPQAIDGVQYRLTWMGAQAAAFFAKHGHLLRLGARMIVTATDPRPLIDRGELCTMATVLDIQIIERTGAKVANYRPVGLSPQVVTT